MFQYSELNFTGVFAQNVTENVFAVVFCVCDPQNSGLRLGPLGVDVWHVVSTWAQPSRVALRLLPGLYQVPDFATAGFFL